MPRLQCSAGASPAGRAQPSQGGSGRTWGQEACWGGLGEAMFCPRCLTLDCWSEDRRSGVKWQKEGGPIPLQLPGAEREASRCPQGLQGQRQGRRCPAGRRPGGGGLSSAVRGPCGLGVSVGLRGAHQEQGQSCPPTSFPSTAASPAMDTRWAGSWPQITACPGKRETLLFCSLTPHLTVGCASLAGHGAPLHPLPS